MKTSYLKAGLVALAIVGALFPSRSQAQESLPSDEEVGYYYGKYRETIYEAQGFDDEDIAFLVFSDVNALGNATFAAYYFIFEEVSAETDDFVWTIIDEQTALYNYFGAFYAKLAGDNFWDDYFADELSDIVNAWYAYGFATTAANDEILEILEDIILEED